VRKINLRIFVYQGLTTAMPSHSSTAAGIIMPKATRTTLDLNAGFSFALATEEQPKTSTAVYTKHE
jgi:hypothetical protein